MSVIIDGTNGISTPGVDSTNLVLDGSTSGSITVVAPAVAGTNTITLPAGTGTAAVQGVSTNIVSRTAVSASGTAVDFTSIPSWVKRVTVMFSGVSTNGTARVQLQIGPSGGVVTTGYTSYVGMASANTNITTGFAAEAGSSAANWIRTGHFVLTLADLSTNLWVYSTSMGVVDGATGYGASGGGSIALAGALSILRVTTVGGTNTFDAGSINILYE